MKPGQSNWINYITAWLDIKFWNRNIKCKQKTHWCITGAVMKPEQSDWINCVAAWLDIKFWNRNMKCKQKIQTIDV